MKILGKILYGTFVTLLAAVAALLLVSLVPVAGNIEIKIVKSGSMEPQIPVGSVVLVKPTTTYKAGDVITFGKDSAREIPTTHRIVSVREAAGGPYYTTMGDANEEADPREIAQSEIIGKVFLTVPYAGFVLDFARQPFGFAFLIGLPAAMIVVDETFTIVQEIRKLRRRKNKKQALAVPQKPQFYRQPARLNFSRSGGRIPTI